MRVGFRCASIVNQGASKSPRHVVATTAVAHPYVRSGGRMRRLALLKTASIGTGCDKLGCFTAATFEWSADDAEEAATTALMVTAVRAYAALDALVFSQQFPRALHGTSAGLPCGFIGGPAAALFNECGLVSAFPRLSFSGAYRSWLSWSGGGNSPEPAFGSLDAMVGPAAFLKDEGKGEGKDEGKGEGRVARGLLTIAYDGRARSGRTVQQELSAIHLEPPWGRAAATYSDAKAFCLAERRCRGFTWQAPNAKATGPRGKAEGQGQAASPAELAGAAYVPHTLEPPALGVKGLWKFVTDAPADGRVRIPLAFYETSSATTLGGLVAAPVLMPRDQGLSETIAITALSRPMSVGASPTGTTGAGADGVAAAVASMPMRPTRASRRGAIIAACEEDICAVGPTRRGVEVATAQGLVRQTLRCQGVTTIWLFSEAAPRLRS